MRKNAINWRRTLLGSLAEIFCPMMLMMIIVIARLVIIVEIRDDSKLMEFKKPFFPTSFLNAEGTIWEDENFEITE